MPDYLGDLDSLINNLESAIEEVEEVDFALAPGQPPRPGVVRITSGAYTSRMDRKPRAAEVHELNEGKLVFRTRSDVARGMEVEVEIYASKDANGEVVYNVEATVEMTRRVSGAYESRAAVRNLGKIVVPIKKLFMKYAVVSDAASWNRWCAELESGPVLKGLDLKHMILVNFDFCCADLSGCNLSESDLSGCNLSGADLSGCLLDGVRIAGADLFRAKIPRKYMGLILASGTIEAESVILV